MDVSDASSPSEAFVNSNSAAVLADAVKILATLLSNLAKEDKLTESFLWLPSLEGPVSDYTKGSGWLFGDAAQGYAWNGFTPPLGWADTAAYLTLPVRRALRPRTGRRRPPRCAWRERVAWARGTRDRRCSGDDAAADCRRRGG